MLHERLNILNDHENVMNPISSGHSLDKTTLRFRDYRKGQSSSDTTAFHHQP